MKNLESTRYIKTLSELKKKIQEAQLRASISVNRELILLYWEIGNTILGRQKQDGWGSKVIENLSRDISHAFPEMKGFSPRNLKYMRKFAEIYNDLQFVQQAAAQIP